jgi:hypothetical protein
MVDDKSKEVVIKSKFKYSSDIESPGAIQRDRESFLAAFDCEFSNFTDAYIESGSHLSSVLINCAFNNNS